MCFLRFNKYKGKHIVVINGSVWENQGPDSIKEFSQPNLLDRSGPL